MQPNQVGLADEVFKAVELLIEAFEARSIRYALVGGLAIVFRSRPRFTQDADFLLEVPQVSLPGLLDDLISKGFTLDTPTVIREFVREHITAFQFGNVRIDWLKAVLPVYSRTISDATQLLWSHGHQVRVATAEGLILTKMIAYRLQDKADIETLLAANRGTINLDLIRKEWVPFGQTEPDRTKWLEEQIALNVPQASGGS